MTSVRQAFGHLLEACINSVRGRMVGTAAELQLRSQLFSRQRHRDGKDPARIAMISGDAVKTPPLGYGGVQRQFYFEARCLARQGWDVHLWGDFQDRSTGLYEGITLHQGIDHEGYGVLRVHPDLIYQAYPTERLIKRYLQLGDCVVMADFNSPALFPPLSPMLFLRCMNQQFRELAIASGYALEQVICQLPYLGTENAWRPDIPREDWLLWIGRADSCKALEEALVFANLTGVKVKIACRQPDLDRDAYARALWALMPATVEYVGEVGPEERADLYSRCRSLLYTVRPWWKEAFGQIFLDALASGTPVLAMDHHPGSTQSAFFPGPPYGLRAASIEELARLYEAHGHELRPDAVAARFDEIYGQERVERRLDAELRRLVEKASRYTSA